MPNENSSRTTHRDNEADQGRVLQDAYRHLIRGRDGANFAEQFHREKESLLQWGKERACLYSRAEAETFLKHLDYLGGGNEHVVYLDKVQEYVIKFTIPPNYGARGAAKDYLENLILSNEILDSGFELVGLAEHFSHNNKHLHHSPLLFLNPLFQVNEHPIQKFMRFSPD